jgi:Fe-S-cluster containining protein
MTPPNSNGSAAEDICLTCGLCCNGVIFARVQLQPEDDADHLNSLGLQLRTQRNRTKDASAQPARSGATTPARFFSQPCAAFDGCRCRIYDDRPVYCRHFECLLLKNVKAGHTQLAAALRIISTARERVERVRRLLRALGDTDEHLPLSARFRRTSRRLEHADPDKATAKAYGELTMAVHDLNCILSEAFYPGEAT